MLNINRVLKEDRLLRALTGLNRKAFDELLQAFSALLDFEASLLSEEFPPYWREVNPRERLWEQIKEKLKWELFNNKRGFQRKLRENSE